MEEEEYEQEKEGDRRRRRMKRGAGGGRGGAGGRQEAALRASVQAFRGDNDGSLSSALLYSTPQGNKQKNK